MGAPPHPSPIYLPLHLRPTGWTQQGARRQKSDSCCNPLSPASQGTVRGKDTQPLLSTDTPLPWGNSILGGIFKFLCIFNWRIIALQYCVGFCHTDINMNQPEVYIRPLPLKPPSHHPPHPTPLGCHRALVCSMHQTANFHWLSTSHTVMDPFPCYSLKSSLLPPLCPWVCPQVRASIAALQTGPSAPSF